MVISAKLFINWYYFDLILSHFRWLSFDEDSQELGVVASSAFHDHCVLKTCHVTVTSSEMIGACDLDHVTGSDHRPIRLFVLTAATDGKVAFWDVTDIYRTLASCSQSTSEMKKSHNLDPFFTLELHQSGINSLFYGNYTGKM